MVEELEKDLAPLTILAHKQVRLNCRRHQYNLFW